MTHAVALRRSRGRIRDPHPGCPGALELAARCYDPAACALVGAWVVWRCARCGCLIGTDADQVVRFVRRNRRRD